MYFMITLVSLAALFFRHATLPKEHGCFEQRYIPLPAVNQSELDSQNQGVIRAKKSKDSVPLTWRIIGLIPGH